MPLTVIALAAPGLLRFARNDVEHLPRDAVKHIEGKLWEIRVDAASGIARAVYVTATGRRVVIVRAFVKKTQKTPRRDLEIARQRAKEIT